MANDHLYICCDVCGDEFFLAKYYPSQLFSVHTQIGPHLQQFFDKHFKCRPVKLGETLNGAVVQRPNDLRGYSGFFIKTTSERTSHPIGGVPLKLGVKDEPS